MIASGTWRDVVASVLECLASDLAPESFKSVRPSTDFAGFVKDWVTMRNKKEPAHEPRAIAWNARTFTIAAAISVFVAEVLFVSLDIAIRNFGGRFSTYLGDFAALYLAVGVTAIAVFISWERISRSARASTQPPLLTRFSSFAIPYAVALSAATLILPVLVRTLGLQVFIASLAIAVVAFVVAVGTYLIGARLAIRGRTFKWAAFARREFWMYVVVAATTTIATVAALHLWHMDWNIPLSYQGDSLAAAGQIDMLNRTGWYDINQLLGFPFGQINHDYPQGSFLSYVNLWILFRFVHGTAAVMNIYYLLGYLLSALVAARLFRAIGINRAIAVVLAVLFAIAPYHFFRNENHYFLSNYWVVPLFGLVVVKLLAGRSLWVRRPARPLAGYLNWSNLGYVVLLVVVGSTVQYYAAFALLILPVAALIGLLRNGRFRPIWGHLLGWTVICATFFLCLLPDLIYEQSVGPNYEATYRPAVHSEWFSIKIVQLLLPVDFHRPGVLQNLAHAYELQFPAYTQTGLGIIGSIGFLILLGVGLVATARFAARRRKVLSRVDYRLGILLSTTLESEANLTGENGATGFGSSLPVLGF